jgi:hypothetical protein
MMWHTLAMITDDVLPNWPPPDGEPIGEERARQYITWIREHAGPLVADARKQITDRYPHAVTKTSAAMVDQLASWSFDDRMTGLGIGSVWASVSGGTWAMMDIWIRRDGRLETRPSMNMRA